MTVYFEIRVIMDLSLTWCCLVLCVTLDEDAKIKTQLEQTNKALSKELEEVKSTLSQTEQTLKAVEEQRTTYRDHMSKSANSLMATVKGLLAVLKKVHRVLPQHVSLFLFHPDSRTELKLNNCFCLSLRIKTLTSLGKKSTTF